MNTCIPARRGDPRQVSLDGAWHIAFDPDNRWKVGAWQERDGPPATALPISVPSCWQTVRPHYDGVAWYWRTFRLSASERQDVILLEFDAVNYAAEVWVDGRFVGQHEGGYTPFRLDIAEALSEDDTHTLVVRVVHPPKNCRPLDGMVLKELPCWREWESFTFGGIWQSVRLLNLPSVYVADCFVRPDADLRGVTAELTCAGGSVPGKLDLAIDLLDARTEECLQSYAPTVEIEQPEGRAEAHLAIANPKPWSPDDPHLYALRVRVPSEGEEADVFTVRFGLRRLALEDGRFVLNGEPIFIKGAFHEGLYPGGLPTPPSREFVEDELRKAKDIGFNLLRYWQIPIHPIVLDVADELGIMLMDEPPIEWMLQTDRTIELCEREVRDLVLRDRNRPSVVFWALVNEAGVIPFQHWPHSAIMGHIDALARLAHDLDPTRMVIDHSGGWHKPARIYGPGAEGGRGFNDFHIYERGPTTERALTVLRTAGGEDGRRGQAPLTAKAPTFPSEFGYGSVPDLAAIAARYEADGMGGNPDCVYHRGLYESLKLHMAQKGLDRLFESPEDFIRETQRLHGTANRLQATAIRANPLTTGYVMHALSAGGWILGAELLDMWRNEKLVCAAVREAQQPRVLSVFLGGPACVEAGGGLPAEIVLANDLEGVNGEALHVVLSGAEGERSVELQPNVSAPRGVTVLWQGELDLGQGPGQVDLRFLLGSSGAPLAIGCRSAWVVEKCLLPKGTSIAFVGQSPNDDAKAALCAMGADLSDDVDRADWVFARPPFDESGSDSPVLRLAAEGRKVLLFGSQRHEVRMMIDALRFRGRERLSVGNWSPVAHCVLDRDLLRGLPGDRILGQAYANVLPRHCVAGRYPPRTSALCMSYQPEDIGGLPLDFWCGSTLFDFSVGKGSVTGCTFQVLEHLKSDPAARLLLRNILSRPERGRR